MGACKSILFTESSCVVELNNSWLILFTTLYFIPLCNNALGSGKVSQSMGLVNSVTKMVTGCSKIAMKLLFLHYRTKEAIVKYVTLSIYDSVFNVCMAYVILLMLQLHFFAILLVTKINLSFFAQNVSSKKG